MAELDSDLYIKDGGCDCPYGWACKHMAALWYAVRAQTPDGQPDETDAQQPKQGGNPYRQQLSRIFSRTRYYDYYEAADLGFRLQNWLEDVAREGTAALQQALPLLIPRLQDAFEKADDSDGMLGVLCIWHSTCWKRRSWKRPEAFDQFFGQMFG